MSRDGFAVRTMRRREVEVAVDWAAQEGWNPGNHDAEAFYAADPEGFFIAELDGEPIGSVSVVNYSETFAFAGLYILKPEYRNRGYGSRLFAAGMAHAGDRNIGGDGVLAMQEKYRTRSGFTLAYRNIRFEGAGGGNEPEGPVDIAGVPFEPLAAYDARHFPASRPRFLAAWLRQEGACGRAVLGEDGDVAGYGVVRRCRHGYKIGPLFADTPEIAGEIFLALSAQASSGPVYLDVPEPNAAAVALAQRQGMVPVFETARIYTKAVPDLPLDEVFGVTSFELG
ncbi:GNAT family N-acetyltransferase [Methanoculleus sp. 10]|uniref:GNAT family N-acetyltransferase n=1 Tax=Methanoculleus sp. 10 TaxID=430615 RepID=UPI0025FF3B0D|nr:GNAT family N-acetyltransferase [Methanoculleus sp. 10]